jgi:hypothetical protein
MGRGLAVLCLAALSCAALTKPIDFDAPGETLGRAIERLGAQIGERLYVTANIRDEVVVIHVTDVDQKDLLAKIAEVANAEWRSTPSGMVLERTPIRERALRERSIALRASKVEEYLRQFDKEIAAPFTSDQALAIANGIVEAAKQGELSPYSPAQHSLWNRGPTARLAHRLLRTVPLADLVDLPFAGRRVFAVDPTKLQYRLGSGAKDALTKFVNEQNLWAATVGPIANPEQLNISSNPLTKKSVMADVRTDYYLEVRRAEMDTPLFCNLLRPTPSGRPETVFQVIIPSARNERIWQALGPIKKLPDVPPLVRFVLNSAFNLGLEEGAPLTLSEFERLYEPDQYDLAGAFADSVFDEFFSEDDFVGLVGDGAAFVLPYLFTAERSRELVERHLPDLADVVLKKDNAWVLVVPSDPHMATESRVPRGVLRQFLQSAKRSRAVTFEDVAMLNSRLKEPSILAMVHLRALGVTGWQMFESSSWHVSRLYGSLPFSQRRSLAEGGTVRYGDLPPSGKALFSALTTSKEIYGVIPVSPGLSRGDGRHAEPTLVLADGIPFDATFSLETTSESTAITYSARLGAMVPQYAVTADSIAHQEKSRSAGTSLRGSPDGYAMGTNRTYHFRVTYADDLKQSFIIEYPVPDPDAKPGPWTALPPSIVEQVRTLVGGV